MKSMFTCALLLSVLTVPFQGDCSYVGDLSNRDESTLGCEISVRDQARYLLQIDLIKGTNNKAEKSRLKSILKVELLCMRDTVLYEIEEWEEITACQIKRRNEGHPPPSSHLDWDQLFIKWQKTIERLHYSNVQIENLIEQHTR